LIVSLALGIADALPELIPTIVDVILQIVDTLTRPDMLSKILDAALVLITELAFGLIDAIPQLVDATLDIIDNLVVFLTDPNNIAKLLNAALKIVIALGTGLINAIPRLLGANATLIKKLVDNFKETDWGEVGKNIIDGLLDGLKKAWTSLSKWFSNAWDGLIGGVKDLLGIHSPSKLFEGFGKFINLGLAEGLDEYSNEPINAMENMSSAVAGAFDSDYEMNLGIVEDIPVSQYQGSSMVDSITEEIGFLSANNSTQQPTINISLSIDDTNSDLARALLRSMKITAEEMYA
jgi:phage-related protein